MMRAPRHGGLDIAGSRGQVLRSAGVRLSTLRLEKVERRQAVAAGAVGLCADLLDPIPKIRAYPDNVFRVEDATMHDHIP